MKRNILLVEPAYKTKFPPLGLMKISSYHKELGDNVYFVKGINQRTALSSWDRIYVATLFTYHWKITVETINYYKRLVHDDIQKIFVGGIMATLMSDELWRETGVMPIRGLLDSPDILGENYGYIVEDMIPDYRLFDESSFPEEPALFNDLNPTVNFPYSLVKDSYFGYITRGCVRKCAFCGVHTLEPKFIPYRDITPYIQKIKEKFGEKEHLVLLDNNVLASKEFARIIHDIRDLGFEKGAKLNDRLRHVDFNQGIDGRLMKEKHFRLLSKIQIRPMRIAFDHIKDQQTYQNNIRLAAKYGINQLSNYILYNYKDTPEDFWQRLKINIDLNKEYHLTIYSFPMKYIPLNAKDRTFIDEPRWNWYFIRGVQRILNVLKGTVMTKEDFFYRAFGENEKEFLKILHMPEKILMYRGYEPQELEKAWKRKFESLTDNEKKELLTILCENKTKRSLLIAKIKTKNRKLKNILEFYISDQPVKDELPLFKN